MYKINPIYPSFSLTSTVQKVNDFLRKYTRIGLSLQCGNDQVVFIPGELKIIGKYEIHYAIRNLFVLIWRIFNSLEKKFYEK